MLKFYSANAQGQFLFIGLEKVNVDRLKEGKPIYLQLCDIDPRLTGSLCIAYGETKEVLLEEIKKAGITIHNGPVPETK